MSVTRYGQTVLDREVDIIERSGRVDRRKVIVHAARRCGELLAAHELTDRNAVVHTLIRTAEGAGLNAVEARRAVEKNVAKGEQNPCPAPSGGTMLQDRADAIVTAMRLYEVASHDASLRPTDLRIIAAHVLIAMRVGKLRYHADYRTIAEASGVSIGTVSKRVKTISKYVVVAKKGSRIEGTATTWQVIEKRAYGNRPEAYLYGAGSVFPSARALARPDHNLWHGRPGQWRVWCALDDEEGAPARVIAERVGLTPQHVRRLLTTLEGAGVARREDGRWYSADAEPETLVDHQAERHRRYVTDRQVWRERTHPEIVRRRALHRHGKVIVASAVLRGLIRRIEERRKVVDLAAYRDGRAA